MPWHFLINVKKHAMALKRLKNTSLEYFLLRYETFICYLRSWRGGSRPPSSCRVSSVGFHWRQRSWCCSSPRTPSCGEWGAKRQRRVCGSDWAWLVHDVLVVTPVVQAVEADPVGTEGAVKTSLRCHTEVNEMKWNDWRIKSWSKSGYCCKLIKRKTYRQKKHILNLFNVVTNW